MPLHFEELWEDCEKHYQNDNSELGSILDELIIKIELYRVISTKEISEKEIQTIKSRTLGEILLTLTHLSVSENIDVFGALQTALVQRRSEVFKKIPPELKLPG